jgi:hypothetical protein
MNKYILLFLCLAITFTWLNNTQNIAIQNEDCLDQPISKDEAREMIKSAAFKLMGPHFDTSLRKAMELAINDPEAYANGPATCFAPDTDPAVVEAFYRNRSFIENSLGIPDPNSRYNLASRWGTTATDGMGLGQGDITTLTWSYVADGTAIGNGGCQLPDAGTFSSDFITFFNGIYGPPTIPGDFTTAPWHTVFLNMFNSWSAVSGLIFVYEPNDDGATVVTGGSGIVGVRGDMRISGHLIDGNSGVLACNYYPQNGDMIIDTGDNWFGMNSGTGTSNVLAHEVGHGVGLQHVCPINTTKLMEPFVTAAFLGPQEDDILATNRHYGDPEGVNDTSGTATFLGANALPTSYSRSQRSIDDNVDIDYFSFTVSGSTELTGTLTPTGTTYLDGTQTGGGPGGCTPGAPFNALTVSDLMLEIVGTDGVTVIATAAANGPGVAETVASVSLPLVGTYYVRVSQQGGAINSAQMYDLNFNLVAGGGDNPPMAVCMDYTAQLDAAGNVTITGADVDGGSSDAEGPVTLSVSPDTFTCADFGTPVTVTLTVTDSIGQTDTCTAVVTVEDNVAPIVVCQDITIQLDLTGNISIIPADVDGGSTDSCGVSSTLIDIMNFDCTDLGPNDVILTVADVNGNVSMCTAIVTIENNNGLMAVCQDITVQLDPAGMAMIIPSDVDGGSVNNCPGVNPYSIDIDTFDCSNVGPNDVVLTATDDAGNTSTCTAVVTVEDNVPPMVTCLDITVILDGSGTASIVPTDINGGASDACGIDTITIDIESLDCTNVGANDVILTVTDVNGNVNSCTAVVTVEDNEAPIAVCQDVTVQLDVTGMATIVPADVDGGSTDNCGITTFSLDIMSFDCADVGIPVTVTLTVSDLEGSTSSCLAVVTIEDNVAPTAVCQDITISLDSNGMAMIVPADIDGGSTDACGISSISIDMNTFDCSNVGPNNVTLSILDINGNTSICIAVVTVEEENAVPVAVCQNLTVPVQQDGTATITPQSVDGGSTGDGCINGLSLDIDSFDCSNIGTPVMVTLTVTNGNGDTSSCTAIITIVDNIGPEVTCPEDQLIEVVDTYILPDYFGIGEAIAVDNCAVPVTIFSQDPPVGTALGFGVYTIELTATDDYNHSTTCSFELTIGDILGVDDQEALLNTIMLYPNPANDYIIINNPENVELKQLLIYDLLGRQIQVENLEGAGTTSSVDVSSLQSTTYLFVIQSENGQRIKQVVKE